MNKLTEYELEQLIKLAPAPVRNQVARLVAELRELREQAGERERMAGEERQW